MIYRLGCCRSATGKEAPDATEAALRVGAEAEVEAELEVVGAADERNRMFAWRPTQTEASSPRRHVIMNVIPVSGCEILRKLSNANASWRHAICPCTVLTGLSMTARTIWALLHPRCQMHACTTVAVDRAYTLDIHYGYAVAYKIAF